MLPVVLSRHSDSAVKCVHSSGTPAQLDRSWATEKASPDSPIGDDSILDASGHELRKVLLGMGMEEGGGDLERSILKGSGASNGAVGIGVGPGRPALLPEISRIEFFRLKKQMDELQTQLHSAKAMLQDALSNSVVFSPDQSKQRQKNSAGDLILGSPRRGTPDKGSESQSPSTLSARASTSIPLNGKSPAEQMKILLADNIRLQTENDELRSKMNALEQQSMSFALGDFACLLG